MLPASGWRLEFVSNAVRIVMGTGRRKIILARLATPQLPESQTVLNAQLMVRAPRLARVLSTLLTEVGDGFSSEGTTPMARAMQDAEALVSELREAGVL